MELPGSGLHEPTMSCAKGFVGMCALVCILPSCRQDRGSWDYGWQSWGQQGRCWQNGADLPGLLRICIHVFSRVDLLGGNRWHQSGRENGRDWKARPALQKKLERQAASVV